MHSLRTLPIRSFAFMSSARQALIPFYDFNLCLDRIRDIARLVSPVMKLMHVRRRRPAVAAEHNARSQRHIRHPFSTVIALRHDPYGFVSIRFYFETFPRAERQKNSMWQLAIAATSASSGSTARGSDSGTRTMCGEDDAWITAPPSNVQVWARPERLSVNASSPLRSQWIFALYWAIPEAHGKLEVSLEREIFLLGEWLGPPG